MKTYSQKFDEQYKGKQSIDIELFNDEPLTMKYARYNQSGEVCSRMIGSAQANQKTKNGWKQVQCDTYNCEHRQKNGSGKCACNRIGWLKFLIPSICKDRIFLMRITGQKSLDRLDEYFSLQKAQGNSIKGQYTLFLKQEEQSNSFCKTFNNYVLDILKKEDFISQKTIPQTIEKPNELSTTNAKNVNNPVLKTEESASKATAINKETEKKQEKATKVNTKKEATTQKKATKKETKKTEIPFVTEPDMDKCYVMIGNHTENILKDGKPKEYFVGEFHDMTDNPVDIIIKPEFIEDLSECTLGTIVELDVQEFGGRKIAMDLKYVQRTLLKNIAA